jgi:cytochrome P450
MGAWLARQAGAVRGGATWRARLGAAVRLYLVYAACHVFLRMYRFVRKTKLDRAVLSGLPGYGPDPLGQELMRNFHRLHEWRRETLLKFPGAHLVLTQSPGNEVAAVSEEAVRFVLKDAFEHFTKPDPAVFYLSEELGHFIGADGIFALRHGAQQPALRTEHDKWFAQRKAASKIFTKNNFNQFMGKVFSEKAERLVALMGRVADGGAKTDFQRLAFSFTMDSVQKVFFSREVDTLETPDEFAAAFDAAHHSMMMYLMVNMPVLICSSLFLPWPFGSLWGKHWTNVFLYAHKRLDPHGRNMIAACKVLDDRTYELVRAARQDADLEQRNDLLAQFLKLGDRLSDKELHDIVLNFIIAGRDTTACTLTWFMFEMTQHPEAQAQLCAEIDRVLRGAEPSAELMEPASMPFLTGCLYETLRLHPPVPEDQKECSEDCVFVSKDGKTSQRIPKGTRVSFLPYSQCRDPTVWEQPDEFRPLRWVPFVEPSPYAFPVFQAGPRLCLGRDMAKFEAKLVVCKLWQRFTFTLLPGEACKITYSNGITMSLVNDKATNSTNLWVLPQRRALPA